ncbi:hypothetical protein TNCV_365001 [Trichonephila clavipes]|nr:hypothetical protein TNCV_365001 [Trichonephila clavipes]
MMGFKSETKDIPKRKLIANDGVYEELFARVFRVALSALRKLAHPDYKACEIFQAFVRIIQNYPNARIVAPYTPTLINSRSRLGARDSIIDLTVLKNISFNYDIRVIDNFCSDYLPIILTLYTNSAIMKIPEQLSANWENFRFPLKNKPLPIPESPSNEYLDVAIGRLGENISKALVAASKPKFKTTPIK